MDENAIGTCAELIFAPIDASFADDAPLLPSGFRIIPLDSGKVCSIKLVYNYSFSWMDSFGYFASFQIAECEFISQSKER